MLKIQNVSKKFGETQAVDDVSFEVKEGSIHTMIGPNGSGKTTLVKMVTGLLGVDAGTIEVDGVDAVRNAKEVKAKTGYIPDNPTIWNKMTGREFLDFTGALYGVEKKERVKRIKELLPIFSLEGIEDAYFEHYSRGNRQKFAILAALLPKPKLLLVDEPIVGLDPESAKIATRIFRDFADDGGTVFIVTHTLSAVDAITDTAGVLSKGTLAASGTLEELREKGGLDERAGLDEVYMAFAGSEAVSEKTVENED